MKQLGKKFRAARTKSALQSRASAPGFTSAELAKELGISRDHACKHIRQLLEGGQLVHTGMKYRMDNGVLKFAPAYDFVKLKKSK